MGDIEADPAGLRHFSDCCRQQQERVIGDAHEQPSGAAFQATAAAVNAIHDGVAAARTTLGERLGATAVRVFAAGANYMATESVSASALHALADGAD